MKKNFVLALVFGALVFASFGFVSALDDSQEVGGVVADNTVISVTPENLNFGSIPFGSDVTWNNGLSTTLDTTGSSTQNGSVFVVISTTGLSKPFFDALLEFDVDPTDVENWLDVTSLGIIEINAGGSWTFPVRLQGDTASFGAGSKSATIVYTIYGLPPA